MLVVSLRVVNMDFGLRVLRTEYQYFKPSRSCFGQHIKKESYKNSAAMLFWQSRLVRPEKWYLLDVKKARVTSRSVSFRGLIRIFRQTSCPFHMEENPGHSDIHGKKSWAIISLYCRLFLELIYFHGEEGRGELV